mgnify:CR=1 FL=1
MENLLFSNLKTPDVPRENSFHAVWLLCCMIVVYEYAVGLSSAELFNLSLAPTATLNFPQIPPQNRGGNAGI